MGGARPRRVLALALEVVSVRSKPSFETAHGSNVIGMLTMRNLIVLLGAGCLLFVLFAFTIIGLAGEALVALSLVGLLLRALAAAGRRARRS